MNPLSGYDLLYKGMSEQDANRLREDIDKLLVASAAEAEKVLTDAIQKAVTAMYDARTCNPWIAILRDCNADAYGFLCSLAEQLWESMCKGEPLKIAKSNEWRVRALIEAWQKAHPDQLAEVANAELLRQNKQLQEQLEFLNRVNESRRL